MSLNTQTTHCIFYLKRAVRTRCKECFGFFLVDSKLAKVVCLLKGHDWAGGSWYILTDGVGLDRRFCGRCCEERSFVD